MAPSPHQSYVAPQRKTHERTTLATLFTLLFTLATSFYSHCSTDARRSNRPPSLPPHRPLCHLTLPRRLALALSALLWLSKHGIGQYVHVSPFGHLQHGEHVVCDFAACPGFVQIKRHAATCQHVSVPCQHASACQHLHAPASLR